MMATVSMLVIVMFLCPILTKGSAALVLQIAVSPLKYLLCRVYGQSGGLMVGSPPVLSILKWRKEIRNQNAAYYSFFVTVRNTNASNNCTSA